MVPGGAPACPACGANLPRGHQRETILLVSLLGIAGLFVFTGFATRLYHQKQADLAERWYSRGQADLKAGHARQATSDFENSLLYAENNDVYRLSLAEALLADNRTEEARDHLLNLWSDSPESGTVNRELGRLAAKEGNVPEAVRYYHNAIYGIWIYVGDPEKNRLKSRLELSKFLVDRNQKTLAEAELIALTGELPPDANLRAEVGDWFRRIGDNSRALAQYRLALRLAPAQQEALLGAGVVAFQMADYRLARLYLERAARNDPQDTEAKQKLEMCDLVLGIDPLALHISSAERSRRIIRALGQAVSRLERCAAQRGEILATREPSTALESAYASALKIKPRVRQHILERDQDLMSRVTDLTVEMENLTTSYCGAPTGLDQAILLAAAKHGSTP